MKTSDSLLNQTNDDTNRKTNVSNNNDNNNNDNDKSVLPLILVLGH